MNGHLSQLYVALSDMSRINFVVWSCAKLSGEFSPAGDEEVFVFSQRWP